MRQAAPAAELARRRSPRLSVVRHQIRVELLHDRLTYSSYPPFVGVAREKISRMSKLWHEVR